MYSTVVVLQFAARQCCAHMLHVQQKPLQYVIFELHKCFKFLIKRKTKFILVLDKTKMESVVSETQGKEAPLQVETVISAP